MCIYSYIYINKRLPGLYNRSSRVLYGSLQIDRCAHDAPPDRPLTAKTRTHRFNAYFDAAYATRRPSGQSSLFEKEVPYLYKITGQRSPAHTQHPRNLLFIRIFKCIFIQLWHPRDSLHTECRILKY